MCIAIMSQYFTCHAFDVHFPADLLLFLLHFFVILSYIDYYVLYKMLVVLIKLYLCNIDFLLITLLLSSEAQCYVKMLILENIYIKRLY